MRFKELLKAEKEEIAKKATKKNKKVGGDLGDDTGYSYSLGSMKSCVVFVVFLLTRCAWV